MEKPSLDDLPGLKREDSLENCKQLSLKLENMALSEKRTRQLTEVLPIIIDFLKGKDLLSLRIVCREWKYAVDEFWIEEPKRPIGNENLPTIYLDSRIKLAQFADDMRHPEKSCLEPIPMEIKVGLGLRDEEGAESLSERQVKLFWREAHSCLSQIGQRVASIMFGVGIQDNFKERVAKDTVNMVMSCLQVTPNLEYLMIHTDAVRMESRFAEYYTDNLSLNAGQTCKKFPAMHKLKTLHLCTYDEKCHEIIKNKPAEFLVLFLRQHGYSLKTLILKCKVHQLKNMEPLQVPNLRSLELDIQHCPLEKFQGECVLAEPELPFVSAGIDCLKTVKVKLSWTWRKCDLAALFKWLSKYYSHYTLYLISLLGPTGDDDEEIEESSNSWDWDESVLWNWNNDDDSFCCCWTRGDRNENDDHENEQCSKHQNSDDDGDESTGSKDVLEINDEVFFSWSWARGLRLPKVKNITMYSAYKGSWAWLRGIPRDALETLLIIDNECKDIGDIPLKMRNQGELFKKPWGDGGNAEAESKEDWVEEERLIWDYFPMLQAVAVLWPMWNQEWLKFRSGEEEFEKYMNRSGRHESHE